MNDLSQVLKAGTLLIIETGEYSDSNWHGPVRILKDVTKQELADAYRAEWKREDFPDSWSDEPNSYDFMSWLVKSGRVEAVDDVHSWHVGSYGRFEL